MSKPDKKARYSVKRSSSSTPLSSNLKNASYYREVLIYNDAGVTLYVLTGDNALESIPTLTHHAFTRTLTIKEIIREVTVDKNGFSKDVSDPRERTLSEYTIELDELMEHPIFVKEFNIVIWTRSEVEVMRQYHPCAAENYDKLVNEAVKQCMNKATCNPLRMFVNIHSKKKRTLFTIINGRVLSCKVDNVPYLEEGIWFTEKIADGDNEESLVTYSIIGDTFRELIDSDTFQATVGEREWTMGFTRTAVVAALTEMRSRERSGLTQQEIDDKLASMTAEQSRVVEKYKKDLELAKEDGAQKASRIKILEEKLSQEDAKVNLELAQLKAKTEREKIITERDRQALDRENEYLKMQMARLKLDAERDADKRTSEFERLKLDMERERREYEDRKRQDERRAEQERREYERQVERDRREYERRKQEDERRLAELKYETERLKASVESDKRNCEIYKSDFERQKYQYETAKRQSELIASTASSVPQFLSSILSVGKTVLAATNSPIGYATSKLMKGYLNRR